jgi:hypothetical protein
MKRRGHEKKPSSRGVMNLAREARVKDGMGVQAMIDVHVEVMTVSEDE